MRACTLNGVELHIASYIFTNTFQQNGKIHGYEARLLRALLHKD